MEMCAADHARFHFIVAHGKCGELGTNAHTPRLDFSKGRRTQMIPTKIKESLDEIHLEVLMYFVLWRGG